MAIWSKRCKILKPCSPLRAVSKTNSSPSRSWCASPSPTLAWVPHGRRFMPRIGPAANRKSGVAAAALVERWEREAGQLGFYSRMRFPISAQFTASLHRTVAKAVDIETLRQLVLAAIALKRYELAHQRTTPNLVALTPDLLPELPTDYMDGRPVRYQAGTNGNFRLYSVGKNQVDDGGDPNPVSSNAVSLNRSHNWLNGRDIVWPEAASPDEIAALGWPRVKK